MTGDSEKVRPEKNVGLIQLFKRLCAENSVATAIVYYLKFLQGPDKSLKTIPKLKWTCGVQKAKLDKTIK